MGVGPSHARLTSGSGSSCPGAVVEAGPERHVQFDSCVEIVRPELAPLAASGADDDGEHQGGTRCLPAPATPTAAEIAAHEAAGHVPYRVWCRHCVRGRGRSRAHRIQPEHALGDSAPVVVHLDYCLYAATAGADADQATALAAAAAELLHALGRLQRPRCTS